MKIHEPSGGNIGQVKDSARPAKAGDVKSRRQGPEVDPGGDQVNLSERARAAAAALAVVESTPEVRVDRVEAIREQVASGQYKVDAEKVANKLVEEHLSELL